MLDYSQSLPLILENYRIAIAHHEHLRTSENMVVKLVSDGGVFYALRIRKVIGSYHEQIMSELTFLRDLHKHSASHIPMPIATNNGQLFCVISIDGGYGYYLFDLAHLLFEFIGDPRYGALKNTAVEQYAATRGTERIPDEDLDMFLALQGIAYANWLYRLFWRDGNCDALNYWVPIILQRLKTITGQQ